MSDKWILVVDDDTANLTVANNILSEAEMRVSCVKSGAQAVKFLQSNKPDLILLDVHMPEMNGFETLAAIRQNRVSGSGVSEVLNNNDIPVLLCRTYCSCGSTMRSI